MFVRVCVELLILHLVSDSKVVPNPPIQMNAKYPTFSLTEMSNTSNLTTITQSHQEKTHYIICPSIKHFLKPNFGSISSINSQIHFNSSWPGSVSAQKQENHQTMQDMHLIYTQSPTFTKCKFMPSFTQQNPLGL